MATVQVIGPRPPTIPETGDSPVRTGSPRSRVPWHCLVPFLLVLLILAAFLPAIMADYVYWDDDDLLINNTRYRTFSADTLAWMVTTSHAGHFQPLTWLSYWLDWTLWNREVAGYHFTNVFLHACAALVVYFLIKRLIRLDVKARRPDSFLSIHSAQLCLIAGVGAAFFAIHPLRVESVAWLAERRDVLAGLFFVLAVAAYVRWQGEAAGNKRGRGWFWAAVTLQGVSLLAKASAVPLPLVLLILDVYPLRRLAHLPWARRLMVLAWDKVPFLILSVAAGMRAWAAQVEAGAMHPLAEHDVTSRVAQALYGLSFYVWKTIVPTALSPLYQIPKREVLLGPYLWVGVLGGVMLAVVAIAARTRWPAITAALAAFAIMVGPVSGLFQCGPQLVADRYSYLSCLGFAVVAAGALFAAVQSAWFRRPQARAVVTVLCALVLTGLFHATTAQAKVWSSALSLWTHAVKYSPDSSIVRTNLADAFVSLGNLELAAHHYRRALQLDPRDPIAAHHFADALAAMGDRHGALEMYLHSLRLDQSRPRLFISLANLLLDSDRDVDALILLRERVQRAPYDLIAAAYLAELLATHPDETIRDGCEAAALAEVVSHAYGDQDAAVLLTLASAQAEEGLWGEALTTAHRGLALADRRRQVWLSEELQHRIGLFEQKIPYRDHH